MRVSTHVQQTRRWFDKLHKPDTNYKGVTPLFLLVNRDMPKIVAAQGRWKPLQRNDLQRFSKTSSLMSLLMKGPCLRGRKDLGPTVSPGRSGNYKP